MARVNAAWLDPVSTNPSLLVNREAELAELVARLNDYREAGKHDANVIISGARGVGKSIFTRKAIHQFAKEHPNQVVCVTIDARGQQYRPVLNSVATQLVEQLQKAAANGPAYDYPLWLDQLALLASANQITLAQVQTIARKHGVEAGASAGSELLGKLSFKAAWEETRSLGMTTSSVLVVTDDLLHAAIVATLERLEQSRWFVVIFFDDLDQTVAGDAEADVVQLHSRVLALRPSLSLIHFRTEAMIENVRREATEMIDLKPLKAETLFEIVQRRLVAAPEAVRKQFPSANDWGAVRQLTKKTGNPLVLLRWTHALLRVHGWPPPSDWDQPGKLQEIVAKADLLPGTDVELVRRLVDIVDRCAPMGTLRAVSREDLARGCLATDAGKGALGLTSDEIDDLLKLEVILPVQRFQPKAGYRVQPVLDLLRPSAWP
jgi:Cdc6-like AAA superfamily ATPase